MTKSDETGDQLFATSRFVDRHIGPTADDVASMLKTLEYPSLDKLIDTVVPASIRLKKPLGLKKPLAEHEALAKLKVIANKNKLFRSFIGMGYSDCIIPGVIQRNILENPGWYTQYTPYQAEIAQGRLEALLNFQTMVADLTGLPIANASLLDEATAAAEAMGLCVAAKKAEHSALYFIARDCHPQTIALVQTRAEPLGVEVLVGDPLSFDFKRRPCGVLLQYPGTDGSLHDYSGLIKEAHAAGALVTMACDLLSLTMLKPPGELGADIAVGSTQRFGVPLGYGGPHAAFFSTTEENKRKIPGRIIGLSRDAAGNQALRMALQTREQHIRRDKATSNICTSQVLLAIMASMYAVYHGPAGLMAIAKRIHQLTNILANGLKKLGYDTTNRHFFDTLTIAISDDKRNTILKNAQQKQINFRIDHYKTLGIALDEKSTLTDVEDILSVFGDACGQSVSMKNLLNIAESCEPGIKSSLLRQSRFLVHPVFNSHHSETKMLRYIRRLEARDLSLTRSMIPLGSCTMKLNATAELYPVTWPEFGNLHPFAPVEQATGYQELFKELENLLAACTGFDGVSLQPNSGAQGEYAGLLVIRRYHQSRGEKHRNICLIPKSAHGTNPASAVMAGMRVIVTECDAQGNIDFADLEAKAKEHSANLAALMVTYPSTHGVFEEGISKICALIHRHGGQVYMDGANMNAQIGLCRPGEYGPDVCHLNLHKTFCIPHGGGGPGVGPIAVKAHLAPYLPTHPLIKTGGDEGTGAVSAAPWGSASILPISLMYIWMMGEEGLTRATKVAILNANYVARRLDPHYPVLYRGQGGLVAHECIVDLRQLKAKTNVEVEDVAKRLMDYGFHAPTVSFPVAGTLMIEPTESESLDELNRFCDAMIAIREEIQEIETSKADKNDNLLKNAPHTASAIATSEWEHGYSRERAVFPKEWVRDNKFWPAVARIDGAFGDRNLVCTCLPLEAYQ